MTNEKLIAFMKRVNPILHEPLATTVAEEWASKFIQEFPGFEKAHTPTDDERKALIEQATWALIEWDTDTADRGVRDEHYRDRRADVERIFPILFHRTEVPEPSAEPLRDHLGWDMSLQSKPVAEPDEARVTAALEAWNGATGSDREAMRVALRDAGEVRS